MTEKLLVKLIATGIIVIGSSLMIFARRYKNTDDKNAGYGIAGWTMFILICMWT